MLATSGTTPTAFSPLPVGLEIRASPALEGALLLGALAATPLSILGGAFASFAGQARGHECTAEFVADNALFLLPCALLCLPFLALAWSGFVRRTVLSAGRTTLTTVTSAGRYVRSASAIPCASIRGGQLSATASVAGKRRVRVSYAFNGDNVVIEGVSDASDDQLDALAAAIRAERTSDDEAS